MSFPFEFSRRQGDYDFFSPILNFTGNAAVVTGVGISLAAISYLAFKALGFGKVATTIAVAIPVSIGAAGVAGLVIGCALIAIMANEVGKALNR